MSKSDNGRAIAARIRREHRISRKRFTNKRKHDKIDSRLNDTKTTLKKLTTWLPSPVNAGLRLRLAVKSCSRHIGRTLRVTGVGNQKRIERRPTMQKTNKTPNTVEAIVPERKGLPTSGAWGVFYLFMCVSVGYANFVVYFGTTDMVSKIMLIPSTVGVALFLLYKSMK